MKLVWHHQILLFEPIILQFESGHFENVFAYKNNKTVKETLAVFVKRKQHHFIIENSTTWLV